MAEQKTAYIAELVNIPDRKIYAARLAPRLKRDTHPAVYVGGEGGERVFVTKL